MELKIIVANESAMEVILALKNVVENSPTGVSFLSVRWYENEYKELSHYSINFGASYEKAKQKDIEFLKSLNVWEHIWKSSMSDILEAQRQLLFAFIEPSKPRSDGQKDAYEYISPGVKVHKTTGKLYVYGYLKSKRVLRPGNYPSVNSKPLTIAKDEIRSLLRTGRFRQFALSFNVLRVNGRSLFIDYPPQVITTIKL